VFLTHVHLDHAGGAGLLMQQLPNARCVVHPRGAPHMVDPAKLIAGTEAVYGKSRTRALYGDIQPIKADRIIEPADGQRFLLAGREFELFYTEGHARHHYCIHDPVSRGVFTGDSFGVSYREFDTAVGEWVFPTTTPMHFDPVQAHVSVDRIMSFDPEQLYLTHYSRVSDPGRLASDMHRGIDDFVAMARACADFPERGVRLRATMFDYFAERLETHGFAGSPDEIRSILQLDVDLNSQGLEVWLDRQG
jgi:glyoxylase-like metal-dependent hydrolase (beta-lactamase superfamily II)